MPDLKSDAGLVFEGTVKSVGTSNVLSVPAHNKTAIVEVNHVRHAPRAMAGLAGQEITVLQAPGEKLKAEDHFIFYANSLVFADNLAVQSVGHDVLNALEVHARLMAADPVVTRLRERVDRAQAVVSGRVLDVRPVPEPTIRLAASSATGPTPPISEHDPLWEEAVVEVQEVQKGDPPSQVVVRFPSSTDVHWYQSPKFVKGQTGTWLLHNELPTADAAAFSARSTAVRGARQQRPVYTVVDANDYFPPSMTSMVSAIATGSEDVQAPKRRAVAAAKAKTVAVAKAKKPAVSMAKARGKKAAAKRRK
jgi:hypothetical protein